jgi:SAM-dependent methyltransferase
MSDPLHLYSDLAWLWPLWGDPDVEYAAWCNQVTLLIRQYAMRDVHTLLNLGCGGGKNIYNLRKHFVVTGVDISKPMLDLAQRLNPQCRFILGDMRDCILGEEFDAVLIDDAILYMANRHDLARVFRNAYRHMKPGGVMIVMPDYTKEIFRQNWTQVSYANSKYKPANVEVVFIENEYDPDPSDETCEDTIIYLIRENGVLTIESDHSVVGLFSLDVWRAILHETGFEVHEEVYCGEPEPTLFACVKRT